MSTQPKPSILWLFSGVMVQIFAVGCGSILSGAATAVSAKIGIQENTIAAIAVATLLFGFVVSLFFGLWDLTRVARRDEPAVPLRWIVGSLAALFIAGPIWRICVVYIQEPISGSDSVRTIFDFVLYGLNVSLFLPFALGVPLILGFLRRHSRMDSAPATE